MAMVKVEEGEEEETNGLQSTRRQENCEGVEREDSLYALVNTKVELNEYSRQQNLNEYDSQNQGDLRMKQLFDKDVETNFKQNSVL